MWALKYLAPKCFLLRGEGRSASESDSGWTRLFGDSHSSLWDSGFGPPEVSDGASKETVSLDDVSGAISVPWSSRGASVSGELVCPLRGKRDIILHQSVLIRTEYKRKLAFYLVYDHVTVQYLSFYEIGNLFVILKYAIDINIFFLDDCILSRNNYRLNSLYINLINRDFQIVIAASLFLFFSVDGHLAA